MAGAGCALRDLERVHRDPVLPEEGMGRSSERRSPCRVLYGASDRQMGTIVTRLCLAVLIAQPMA